MTYTDDFGLERHSFHCTCLKCSPNCTHGWEWPEGSHQHACGQKVQPHTSFHTCECGARTRLRVARKDGECWWDPKYNKRAKRKANSE